MGDKYSLEFELTGDGAQKLNEQIAAAERKVADSFAKLSAQSKISSEKIQSYGRQVADVEKARNQAVYEDYKRGLKQKESDQNSYVSKQIQNINRLAEVQKKAESDVNKLAADRLRNAAQQNNINSGFTGQTSGVQNFGQTDLKGDVGSAKYISQLKQLRSELSPTSAEFQKLNIVIATHERALDKAAGKSAFFRDKGLNLAKDASLIAMNVRGLFGDLNDLGNSLQGASVDFGKLGASAGSASLSILALVPAFNSIKKAIPTNEFTKGAGAMSLFTIASADLVNKGMTLVDALKRMTSGGEGFFQAIGNALSNNTIGQLTKEIFGIKDASDVAADSLNRLALATQNALKGAQLQEMNRRRELDLTPEMVQFEKEFEKQTKELKDANKVTKTGTGSTGTSVVKEMESELSKFLKTLSQEVELKTLLKTLDASYLSGKLRELELYNTENLSIEEQIELLKKRNELRSELFKATPGFFFSEIGIPKLGEKDGEVVDRLKGSKSPTEDFWKLVSEQANKMTQAFSGMLGFTDSILQKFGLADSVVGNIVRELSSLLGIATQGVGVISTIAGLFGGGGGMAGMQKNPSAVSYGGGGGMLSATINLPATVFEPARAERVLVKLMPGVNNILTNKNYAVAY